MVDQLGLFAAPAKCGEVRQSAHRSVPTAADVISAGLTPWQWFVRRYPAASRIVGRFEARTEMEVVREGIATPAIRASFDEWYRRRFGSPCDVPLTPRL